MALLRAAGAADAGAGGVCVPHQLHAQPVVPGKAGPARNDRHLVSLLHPLTTCPGAFAVLLDVPDCGWLVGSTELTAVNTLRHLKTP